MWKPRDIGSGIDFGYSGSKIPDPGLMENMEFNVRDGKLHIIPIWVNATGICTIHEQIVVRWLIYILKSELMSVNRAPEARAKIHVYINMTNVRNNFFTRIWIWLKIYLRQFGEGVSVLLRQMDFTFAIGEMRRLMCIPDDVHCT